MEPSVVWSSGCSWIGKRTSPVASFLPSSLKYIERAGSKGVLLLCWKDFLFVKNVNLRVFQRWARYGRFVIEKTDLWIQVVGHKFEVSSSVGLQISGNRLKWKQLLSDLLGWFLHNLWKPIGGRTPSRTPSNQYPADDLDGNGAWSILPRRVRGNTSALGLSDLLICLPKYRVILQAEPMFSWQTRHVEPQGVSIGPLVAATAWTFHSMALTKAWSSSGWMTSPTGCSC